MPRRWARRIHLSPRALRLCRFILGLITEPKGSGWHGRMNLVFLFPLESIPGVELEGCWEEFARVVREREVTEIVVGYPIHMDGEVGMRAKEVDTFITKLTQRFELPVHRVDERLTSVAAAESLSVKSKGRKDGRIDATAASLILRDFLEGKGS